VKKVKTTEESYIFEIFQRMNHHKL